MCMLHKSFRLKGTLRKLNRFNKMVAMGPICRLTSRWYIPGLTLGLLVCLVSSMPKQSYKAEVHINDFVEDDVLNGEPVTLLNQEQLFEDKKPSVSLSKKEKDHEGVRVQDKPPINKKQSKPKTTKSFHDLDAVDHTCTPVTIPVCRDLDLYPLAQYPNHLGHRSQAEAGKDLVHYLPLLKHPRCAALLKEFICVLYAPQCAGTGEPLLPCRAGCQAALEACTTALKDTALTWPTQWTCDRLPDRGLCEEMYNKATPVPEPQHSVIKSKSSHTKLYDQSAVHQATKNTGISPDRSISANQLKPRNYNIAQLGQSEFFQGWADVQGQGAANDYCRVIGSNPNLWFLSCTLGGSTSGDHVFVSRRGFDAGHRHTWYMRDMDGDGRDDYCRCVGKGLKSYVSCMKAGEFGFYGSPQQPGSEYTFPVHTDGPCYQKNVNPHFGV